MYVSPLQAHCDATSEGKLDLDKLRVKDCNAKACRCKQTQRTRRTLSFWSRQKRFKKKAVQPTWKPVEPAKLTVKDHMGKVLSGSATLQGNTKATAYIVT